MYKILIVGALSQELKIIKSEIKKIGFKKIKPIFLTTGIGNYNMILNLTRFLENHEVDFIVNIGVCGYIEENINFLQVGRVKNISDNKELILPYIFDFGKIKSISSSEKIIYDGNEIEEQFVDMESYGFEKVCESFDIPRIILKVPVDKIGIETKNFDFKKAEKKLKDNIDYLSLFKKIENYLEKNKKEKIDLLMYYNYFSFSFTQKNIFEKLYNKYEVLTGENFEDYFLKYIRNLKEIKNKKYESKRFLENLENYLEDK